MLDQQVINNISNALDHIKLNENMSVDEALDALSNIRKYIPNKRWGITAEKKGLQIYAFEGEFPNYQMFDHLIDTQPAKHVASVISDIDHRNWNEARDRANHFWNDPIERVDIYDIQKNDNPAPRKDPDEYEDALGEDEETEDAIICEHATLCAVKGSDGHVGLLLYDDEGEAMSATDYNEIMHELQYDKPYNSLDHQQNLNVNDVKQHIARACESAPVYQHTIAWNLEEKDNIQFIVDGHLYDSYDPDTDWDKHQAYFMTETIVAGDLSHAENETQMNKLIRAGEDHDKIDLVDTSDIQKTSEEDEKEDTI